jgi:PadR family transcriptional regulator PadR
MRCMIEGADADRQAQLLRGALDMCLLALLAERPAHGYELVQRVGEVGFPSVGYGTIYPLLTRMRRLDLVVQEVRDSPSGPDRKVYTVTEAGLERLGDWSGQWHDFVGVVGRVLAGGVSSEARSRG